MTGASVDALAFRLTANPTVSARARRQGFGISSTVEGSAKSSNITDVLQISEH